MYLGIEIGGTKLQLGVGDGREARFLEFVRRDVDPAHGAEGILRQIHETAAALIARHPIERVGYGFGGPVLGTAGRTITSHQIEGWDDFPLVEWTREALGLPSALGNDCDVAALAESRYGAGRGRRIVLYVTVGTGIGGGLVIDGRIHGTQRPAATELGHLRPGLEARDRHDTVESIASGRGIETAARSWLADSSQQDSERTSRDATDLLRRCGSNSESLTARMVAEAATAGNSAAATILRRATDVLGWAIAQAVTLTSPEVVVIGGGVSLIGDNWFFQPVRKAVAQYVFPPLAENFTVLPAELGEPVVVHGAIALAAGAD